MLQDNEIEEIKERIIKHINENFPEDKKQLAIEKINSMNNEQLIDFLNQNNLIKEDIENPEESCIFCLISSKRINSCIIKEDSNNIAVLDINPLSEGHSIIIPKKHKKIDESSLLMVQEIEKMIKENLKPKEIKEEKSEFIGHEIISLIPIYEGKELKKSQKSIEELEKLKRKILLEENDNEKKLKEDKKEINEKEKIEEDLSPLQSKEIKEEKLWIPKRIP
jgi:diadenosine tetraphosphate (Ap4A) HIT family hydrolase